MIELKDISTMGLLNELKDYKNEEECIIYEILTLHEVKNYQQLKELYEEELERRKKGISSPFLDKHIIAGTLYEIKKYIDKCNKISGNINFENSDINVLYPFTYNQENVDDNVYSEDLIYGTIIDYSARKAKLRGYTIYDLKKYLNKNQFQYRFREHGAKQTKIVENSIKFYDEQIERQALYYNPFIHNESDIFYLYQDSKKELVEDQLKEIVEYLTDIANKCIWGNLSDFEKKKFIDLAYKNTRVSNERREKFINTISNYVTIDEAKQGLVKTKAIDRFIIK